MWTDENHIEINRNAIRHQKYCIDNRQQQLNCGIVCTLHIVFTVLQRSLDAGCVLCNTNEPNMKKWWNESAVYIWFFFCSAVFIYSFDCTTMLMNNWNLFLSVFYLWIVKFIHFSSIKYITPKRFRSALIALWMW